MKQNLIAFVAALVMASAAFGQTGVSFQTPKIESQVPQPIAGLTGVVCLDTALGTPCAPTVSVFSDKALTTPITLTTDGDGMFPTFFIAPGQYQWCASDILGRISAYCTKFTAPAASGSSPTFAAITVTGNSALNGNVSVGGTLGAKTLQGIPHCKDFATPGVTSFDAMMTACVAALGATGSGTVNAMDVTDTTNLTMTANWTMSRSGTTVLFGQYQVNQGAFSIIVPSPTSNVKFLGSGAWGTLPNGGVNGTYFKYTGSGSAHQFGDATQTSFGHDFEDLVFDLTGASGSAIAVASSRVYGVELKRLRGLCPVGANTMTFIQNNGVVPVGSQSMTLEEVVENNCQFGFTNIGQTAPPTCNNVKFIGGQFSGNSLAGGIAIDIQCGNDIDFIGPYIAGYDIGLKVSSPSRGAVWGRIHMESCTTKGITFTSTSAWNWLWSDTGCVIEDLTAGHTNTVIGATNGTLLFSVDGQINRILNAQDLPINFILTPGLTADQQACLVFQNKSAVTQFSLCKLTDNTLALQDSSSRNLMAWPLPGSTVFQINAPFGAAGAVDLNSAANSGTSGTRFWNGGATPAMIAIISGTSIRPGVVNVTSLGTTALPFTSLFIGAAATNNIQITGTATGARTATLQDATGTIPLTIASGTSTFTTTAVGAGACQTTVTTTATNALTSDTITTAYSTAPTGTTDGILILNKWVTAGNVNFARCNPTAGSITPTALVLNWRVVR